MTVYEGGRSSAAYWWDSDGNGVYGDGPDSIPEGENRRLFRNPDGSYDFIELSGTVWHFDSSGTLLYLRDRNGNTLDFLHGGGTAPPDALTGVIDTYGRLITYEYYSGTGTVKDGKLWKVVDFAGRVVEFDYDSNGNLTSATTPAVQQTYPGGTNTFASGKRETYTYVQHSLRWLLTSVVRPNENDPNHGVAPDGTALVVNTFDPGTERLISQVRGPSQDVLGNPVPNVLTFTYEDSGDPGFWPPDFDPLLEDYPALKTTIVDRRGNQRSYYTALGTGAVTRYEIPEANVLDDSGGPAAKTLLTRYKYDVQGGHPGGSNQLGQVTYPNGKQVLYTYEDNSTNPLLPTSSNVILIEERPGITKDPITGLTVPNDQGSRTVTFTYEPIFNQLLSITDERGNDPSYIPPIGSQSASRYTTQYFYDFMEGDESAIQALADQYHRPITAAQRQALALNQDLNGDMVTDQQRGNPVKVQLPSVQLDPTSPQVAVEGGTTQTVFQVMAYNSLGQLLLDVDPERNISQYLYFPETDPDGDGIPTTIQPSDPSPPTDTSTGGYLEELVLDVPVPAGFDASKFPPRHETAAEVQAHLSYKYDVAGNITQYANPSGVLFQNYFNERDQVYRSVLAVGKSIEQEIRFEYDANDQLIRTLVKNLSSPAGPWVEENTTFDIEGRTILGRSQITTSGGTPVFAEIRFGLDGNGNLAFLRKPMGNTNAYSYNARDQLSQAIRGFGAPESARTEVFHDSNGNLVLTVRHTEGAPDVVLPDYLIYDGYDRLVGTVDPVGARTKRTLDPVGNAVSSELRGYLGGASPTDNSGSQNVLLASGSTKFDELNRAFETDRDLFGDAG